MSAVQFSNTQLKDALEFLQYKSVELYSEPDRKKKGINIIIQRSSDEEKSVTLKVSNMPLGEVLKHTCALAGYEYTVEDHAVWLVRGENSKLETRNSKLEERETKNEERRTKNEERRTKNETSTFHKIQEPIEEVKRLRATLESESALGFSPCPRRGNCAC